MIIASAVVTFLIAGAITASVAVYRSQLVVVADLSEMSIEEARSALTDRGLRPVVAGSRVSAEVAEGLVLSQDPAPGTSLPPGSEVSFIVSVGSQTAYVPDLVGVPIEEARAALENAGLRVNERTGSSEETRAVVLEMYPAPGTLVNVGDIIRITVPGTSDESGVLLPYELSVVSVLVDPAPASGSDTDPALEVARRLVSLLRASGAEATMIRASAGEGLSRTDRVAASRESTAVVLVGLETASGAGAGITVMYAGGGSAESSGSDPAALARAMTSTLRLPGGRVNPPAATDDPILAAFAGAAVRVRLGDVRDSGDLSRFADPSWADEVARSVYRALGETYATR